MTFYLEPSWWVGIALSLLMIWLLADVSIRAYRCNKYGHVWHDYKGETRCRRCGWKAFIR
jgi:hypothetical protein